MRNFTCPTCNETKPETEFYMNSKVPGKRHAHRCRQCARPRQKKWRDENRELFQYKMRKQAARTRYGLEVEEFLELKNRPCEICGLHREPRLRRMHVDHSIAGSYHGILCDVCNRVLGMLLHDPELFRNAAEYLERTRK